MVNYFLKQSVSDMFSASPARKYGFSFYIADYYHNHGVLASWNILIILTGIAERCNAITKSKNGMNDTI